MKIVFMGTPDFAVPCFEALVKSEYDIIGVFTNPDKKKGRGYAVSMPPVKEIALLNGVKVFQPKTLRSDESYEILKELAPDLIVVVAYGKILPKNILELPPMGCINVHGSLLPKYRGAAPIQWSIINGEEITGITTMYMNEGLDTGDMLLQEEVSIGENETSGELFDRLCKVGSELLIKTIKGIENGSIKRVKQRDEEATYAPMLTKEISRIDWTKNARDIHNLVRGLNPWPKAFTMLDGKVLKIYKTNVLQNVIGKPGEIKSLDPFIVCCGDGNAIKILELQFDSRKRMRAEDFFRGYKNRKINFG